MIGERRGGRDIVSLRDEEEEKESRAKEEEVNSQLVLLTFA